MATRNRPYAASPYYRSTASPSRETKRTMSELSPQSILASPRAGTMEAAESIVPLAVILVAAPMAQGGEAAWAWHALAIAMGVTLAWWAICALRAPMPVGLSWRRHGVTTVLGSALLAWLALQSAQLPIVPVSWHNPAWRETAATLDIDIVGAISIDPGASRDAALRMMTYAAAFWIAMHYARPTEGARRLLAAIATAGALYGVMGLALWAARLGPAFGQNGDAVAGPFGSSAGMAVYVGLCGIAGAALLSSHRALFSPIVVVRSFDLRRIAPGTAVEIAAQLAAVAVIVAALLLTGSATGWIAALAGLTILVAARALNEHAGLGAAMLLGLAVAVSGLLAIHFLGGGLPIPGLDGPTDARLGRGLGAHAAMPGAAGALDGAVSAPGGRPFPVGPNGVAAWVAQTGLPGAALLFAILGWIAAACVRGCLPGRDQATYAAAGLAALALLACQSYLDAGALSPASCITAFALMGVGFGQSWQDGRETRR